MMNRKMKDQENRGWTRMNADGKMGMDGATVDRLGMRGVFVPVCAYPCSYVVHFLIRRYRGRVCLRRIPRRCVHSTLQRLCRRLHFPRQKKSATESR